MNIRLSASMIKDFLSCERKAYYRMNKPEEQEQTYQMAVGSIVHDTLEKYWNNYDKAIEVAENKIKEYNLKRGTSNVFRSLVNFFEHFTYLVKEDDTIEQYFKIPYEMNHWGEFDFSLVGKFDRVTKDGIIIDWKTGSLVPTDISGDIQFILYEYAYTKLYGEKPRRMFYVSLPTQKIIQYTPNEALIKEFITVTLPYVADSLAYNIKNNNFIRTGLFGYKICNNCPFVNVCYKEIGA